MEFLHFPEPPFARGCAGKRKKCAAAAAGFADCAAPLKQRSQANARERDRTHSVNTAFSTLRTLLPTEPKDRKLSKIETLRLASSYISHLGTLLIAGPIDQPCLKFSKSYMGEGNTSSNSRHQICTFCIAHKKSPKPITDDYEMQNYENQIFIDPTSQSLNSPSIITINSAIEDIEDPTSIYYHQ